jgi:purine-cytosine permease-like protein
MDKLMTLLNWVGQDATHFFGTLVFVLLGVVFVVGLLEAFADIIRAIRGKSE